MNVFDYFNYRKFLGDYYVHRKALNKNFSYRYFAMKAGFNSSGLYKSLVSGKQNLTATFLPKFCKAMDLGARECEYFGLMVDFTHAKNAAAKQEYFDRMITLMPRAIQKLKKSQSDYYRAWFHVAVREALEVLDISDNYQDLAGFLSPPIKPAQAKSAVRLLEELELIKQSSKGYWKPKEALVISTQDMEPWIIHGFQKEMMGMGAESLDRYPKEKRNISSATMSISAQGMERVLRKVDQLRDEIMEIAHSDEKVDRVYQFNIQFFPLSRENGA